MKAGLCAIVVYCFIPVMAAGGAEAPQTPPTASQRIGETFARELSLNVGKSLVIESPVDIDRVSIGNDKVAEAFAVTPRQVLVNAKGPGEASLVIWQEGGNRLLFEVTVRASTAVFEAVRREMQEVLEGQNVTIKLHDKSVFLEGTVKDLVSAERAVAMASTVGKVVNLLQVTVPPTQTQVILKVRFASVDKSALQDLGANLFSLGGTNTIGRVTTGDFAAPSISMDATKTTFTLGDALNIFLFRRDLNLGATIKALANRNLLEILAEPNVLAIDGKAASFLAGGEFPYPTLQGGGAGLGSVTIQFREFGVRLTFLPHMTPRGTIRLAVTPEVSALDYANGLTFQGFTIPGLTTRRVQTEIELETGQSFVIGGLLDNRITENLSKIPGLGDLPVLGKLFQSRHQLKNKTELLVMVTPEVVRPIMEGQPRPELQMPRTDFIGTGATAPPQSPGLSTTGPVPVHPARETIPVEQLIQSQKILENQTAPSNSAAPLPVQFVPVPIVPSQSTVPQQAEPGPQSPSATPPQSPGER